MVSLETIKREELCFDQAGNFFRCLHGVAGDSDIGLRCELEPEWH